MKIGLFIPTYKKDYNKVSASIWIRVLQMKKYYESYGIEVYINNIFHLYDIAILYRVTNKKSYYFLKYLKVISKKVYWDSCVNYFEEHEASNSDQVFYARKISKLVDGIITSTENIQDKALLFNSNIFVMDDPIELNHFKYKKMNINFDNPVYGWSGISVKANVLDQYKKYIKRLLIISDKEPDISIKYTFFKWTYEEFPFLLSKIDIAFLPRDYENNAYNSGHSSFKALVFAIQEIPIIANKLPSYVKLSKLYDGIVFLEDFDSFSSALKELRKRNYSNKRISKYYSCESQSYQLLEYLGCINETK